MASSNKIDIRKVNKEIVDIFNKKGATNFDNAIYVEDLKLKYPLKLQYYLIEEFVRNDFIQVLENGKVFLKKDKYNFEIKKVQFIYLLIIFIPFIIGGLLIIL